MSAPDSGRSLGAGALALVACIVAAAATPGAQNWTTYSGDMGGQRHSPLTQITRQNVGDLELQWVFQTRSLEKFEASPLVVDGVLYTVQPPNDVIAMDAATGRVFWTYAHLPSPTARLCCGRVNRGLAIFEQMLFMATIDGRLLAIDAKTGGLVWNIGVAGARPEAGYSLTVAPLVIKDKVIIGTAGGEYGVRGFLAAFDVRSGKEVWRFYTVPGPGEKGHETWAGDSWKTGGGSIWVTGSYDPESNLTYWGVGNPGPDWNGDVRLGDNLFSDSVVALDADTGALKWHFQFTPHDEFDYDSVQVPVLADIQWPEGPGRSGQQRRLRKVMLFANRNGFFYVLDRLTGEYLLGTPFTKVTWTSGLDAKGRPQNVVPVTPEGVLIYPGVQGGTNWYSPTFSPRTGLFYVPVWGDTFSTFTKRPVEYKEGQRYTGALPAMPIRMLTPGPAMNRRRPEDGYGAIQAIDPATGERRWEYKMTDVIDAGVLSTASDLLFSGGREGYAFALDARNGELLWKASIGAQASNAPVTYMANGRQYVAIAAGNVLFSYAVRRR
jgi:alcohol dehydrogenase (cytochrome c)